MQEMEQVDDAFLKTQVALCDITDFEVKSEDGTMIKVHCYKPKSLAGKTNNPCLIYAHGGGAIFFAASRFETSLCEYAVRLNCIVFNVDYRLGP